MRAENVIVLRRRLTGKRPRMSRASCAGTGTTGITFFTRAICFTEPPAGERLQWLSTQSFGASARHVALPKLHPLRVAVAAIAIGASDISSPCNRAYARVVMVGMGLGV